MTTAKKVEHPALPTKVVGVGAPVSVWIYFEVCEIPALLDGIADELARCGCTAELNGRWVEAEAGVDPEDWTPHIGELLGMVSELERATATYASGRFDVTWPTALADGILRQAVVHAERRVASGSDADRARAGLDAAKQTWRDYEAIDSRGAGAWL